MSESPYSKRAGRPMAIAFVSYIPVATASGGTQPLSPLRVRHGRACRNSVNFGAGATISGPFTDMLRRRSQLLPRMIALVASPARQSKREIGWDGMPRNNRLPSNKSAG